MYPHENTLTIIDVMNMNTQITFKENNNFVTNIFISENQINLEHCHKPFLQEITDAQMEYSQTLVNFMSVAKKCVFINIYIYFAIISFRSQLYLYYLTTTEFL